MPLLIFPSDLLHFVTGIIIPNADLLCLTTLNSYAHRLKPKTFSLLYHLAPNFPSGYAEPLWIS